jgi:uncharacterized membrane protein YfcA
MLEYLALPLVGLSIGFLVSVMGGGGGAIYVGVLTVLFNVAPAIAVSSSLATMIPTTAIASLSHWRAKNLKLKLGLWMMGAGMLGTVFGSLASGVLPERLYGKLAGAFLVFFSLQLLIPMLKKRMTKDQPQGSAVTESAPREEGKAISRIAKAILYGLCGGFLSGLVGISGTAPIIVGLTALGCEPLAVAGTSVFVLFGISVVGFLMHMSLGNVNWKLVGLLVAGTATGALAGPLLLKRANKKTISKIMQPLFFLMIFGMGVAQCIK